MKFLCILAFLFVFAKASATFGDDGDNNIVRRVADFDNEDDTFSDHIVEAVDDETVVPQANNYVIGDANLIAEHIGNVPVVDGVRGIGKRIYNKIEDFIHLRFNAMVGYPIHLLFGAINMACRFLASHQKLNPRVSPNIDQMNFVLKVKNDNIFVPLTQSERLWSHEKFHKEWPLVVVVTGWNTDFNGSAITNDALETLYKAYKCRGNINFVTLDSSRFVNTIYTWSAFNTDLVGEHLGRGLVKLIEQSYPVEEIHIIGNLYNFLIFFY